MFILYLLPQVWIPDTRMDTDMDTVVMDMVAMDTVDMVTTGNIEVIKSTLENEECFSLCHGRFVIFENKNEWMFSKKLISLFSLWETFLQYYSNKAKVDCKNTEDI